MQSYAGDNHQEVLKNEEHFLLWSKGRTLGVLASMVTSQPPSSLDTTLYSSMQAASLGPSAFFFKGMVYRTSLFLSPPTQQTGPEPQSQASL